METSPTERHKTYIGRHRIYLSGNIDIKMGEPPGFAVSCNCENRPYAQYLADTGHRYTTSKDNNDIEGKV